MKKRDLYLDKYYLEKLKGYLLGNDKSIKTINNYIDNTIIFIEYFEQIEINIFNPSIITGIDLLVYRNYCKNTLRLGVSSINIRIASLNSYFSYLCLDKFIEKGPCGKIKKLKDSRIKKPKSFDEKTFKELRSLYYREYNLLHVLIFQLLSTCGLLLGEITSLTLDDINMNIEENINTPRIGEVLVRNGKGNKTRSIPLHKETHIAIINWLKVRKRKKVNSPYLLISERKDKFTTNGIYRIVMGYHKRLKINIILSIPIDSTFVTNY